MIYKSGQIFLPFCHNPRVWQTDRQTDRILIARPRLYSMQRGNISTTQPLWLRAVLLTVRCPGICIHRDHGRRSTHGSWRYRSGWSSPGWTA